MTTARNQNRDQRRREVGVARRVATIYSLGVVVTAIPLGMSSAAPGAL
jgi:hypothetical protein